MSEKGKREMGRITVDLESGFARRSVPLTPALSPGVPGERGKSYFGSFPGFHLMLQPMLALCSAGTGLPARTASMAARRSAPVIGLPSSGRLESYCPR